MANFPFKLFSFHTRFFSRTRVVLNLICGFRSTLCSDMLKEMEKLNRYFIRKDSKLNVVSTRTRLQSLFHSEQCRWSSQSSIDNIVSGENAISQQLFLHKTPLRAQSCVIFSRPLRLSMSCKSFVGGIKKNIYSPYVMLLCGFSDNCSFSLRLIVQENCCEHLT